MATLGSLLYYIKAKNQEFKSKMDESKNKIKEFEGQVEKSKKTLQDWTKTARKVGAAATVAFAGIMTAGKYFIDAASEAQEMQNVLEVSFGAMSDEINAWAETTADAVNRSNFQMKDFVSTAMAMISSMVDSKEQAAEMSKTIAQLAVDLASFRNISDERAFEALTAALTGEAEALKRLGYNVQDTAVKQYALNQGIEKAYEEMTIAEKTTLRYQLILERLKDVMGDAERTSDSYANQIKGFQGEVRNLREEMGEYLLPTATKLVGVLRSIVEYINDLPGPVKELAAQGMIIAGAITGIVGPLGLIVGFLPQISSGLKLISTSFKPFLIGGAIITGITFLVNKIIEWRENVNLLKENLEALDKSSAVRRLELLEQEREKLISKAKVFTWGSEKTWQEWIAENAQEEWDRINQQISATKEYIAQLEEQERLEKEIAEQKQRQLEYGIEIEQELNQLISRIISPTAYYEQFGEKAEEIKKYAPWSVDWAIEALDELKTFFETKPPEDFFGDPINWDNLSEEKRLELIEKINQEILRLEYQQATELENLDQQLADKKNELKKDEYEYQIYLLEQEKQALIDSYYEQLGSTQEWLEKKNEVEELYAALIDRIREEQRQKELQEELKKQQFLLSQREISYHDYLEYIEKQLEAEEQYTDRWYMLMNERQNTINAIVQEDMQILEATSKEMYENENERIEWLIIQLEVLKERYAENKVILALINEEIERLKSNITKIGEEPKLNWMEDMFIKIGYSIEEAQSNFQEFKDGLIDGLTYAITKGEDFLDTLKQIADQIAEMIIRRGVVEPFVNWMFTSLFPTAHTGALVTTAGLVQDIPSFHTGGVIKPDERIIKVQTGERILSREQNKAFEAGEFGKKIINLHITAMDSQDVLRALTKDGGQAVAQALGLDYNRNGLSRQIIRKG